MCYFSLRLAVSLAPCRKLPTSLSKHQISFFKGSGSSPCKEGSTLLFQSQPQHPQLPKPRSNPTHLASYQLDWKSKQEDSVPEDITIRRKSKTVTRDFIFDFFFFFLPSNCNYALHKEIRPGTKEVKHPQINLSAGKQIRSHKQRMWLATASSTSTIAKYYP